MRCTSRVSAECELRRRSDALKLFYARGNPNGQSASHSSRYTQLSVCEIDKFINTSLRPYRC